MSTANEKKAWADIGDEDDEGVESTFPASKEEDRTGGRYEYSRVKRPIEKLNANGTTERVDQTYLVKKWVYPVRRQVLDRKKMQKFGEVKDVPKGEHKPGDHHIEQPITIDKAEEQGEIGIVSQIENISTKKVLENIGKREAEKAIQPEAAEDKKEDKWAAMFKNAAPRQNFAIRVTSIISYEDRLEDIEEDLNSFFRALLEKKGLRLHRLRLLKTRDIPPRFINKCILTFDSNENAAKALEAIDGATYNDAILEASWAEPSDPNRRRF